MKDMSVWKSIFLQNSIKKEKRKRSGAGFKEVLDAEIEKEKKKCCKS